jgi:hypothetical protein
MFEVLAKLARMMIALVGLTFPEWGIAGGPLRNGKNTFRA